jgi:hypothetical protein
MQKLDALTQLFDASCSVQFLPAVLQMAAAHRQAGQQPDNLCGPYWVSLLLRVQAGLTMQADQFAQIAGSILPIVDPLLSVPPGAQPRVDYQVALPQTTDLAISGTSVAGLISATQIASSGQYALVPLHAHWTAKRIETVLALCQTHADWNAVPLCNLQTGHLWGANLPLIDALAYLTGETIQQPPADWNVGHFVALAGQVTGMARSLLILQDTYPHFGWNGYHLQSADAAAQALNRSDGNEGGILLFVAEQHCSTVEETCQTAGFTVRVWDNGTP